MTFDERLSKLQSRYAARRPKSRDYIRRASAWMPGGNTRSVLHFDPFPMVMSGGHADMFRDIDGHEYIDCAGEFSAGLYGHGEPVIMEAQLKALEDGVVLSGPNMYESEFAELLCARFPSVELIRFCNSGTEANLFALATARNVTGRDTVMVFEGGYHGGVLTFSDRPGPLNVPFDYCIAPYNDGEAARQAIRENAETLAAILVEPLLGAAGNIPATAEFLAVLREEADRCGAILIFDEVKTSRLGAAGLQGEYGVTPDMTTLGKYLGAGMPFGAFGGRAEILERFDPHRKNGLKHAGTFNNNVMTMSGGLAGLKSVFTPRRAAEFLSLTETFRTEMNARFASAGMPVRFSGIGSILSLHIGETAPRSLKLVDPRTSTLRQLVHLNCLERGLALTPRGDIFLSLPMTGDRLTTIGEILMDAIGEELPLFCLTQGDG